MQRTLKVRVKDKHAKMLSAIAFEVNQVWNYCNDLNKHSYYFQTKKYLSGFSMCSFLKGWSKTEAESTGMPTVQETAAVLSKSTFQHKRVKWRKSFGKIKSLGWVQFKDGKVCFAGKKFDVCDSYGLDEYKLTAGSFCEDSTGRWFFCVAVSIECSDVKAGKRGLLNPAYLIAGVGHGPQVVGIPNALALRGCQVRNIYEL